jgi:hypothetical protein
VDGNQINRRYSRPTNNQSNSRQISQTGNNQPNNCQTSQTGNNQPNNCQTSQAGNSRQTSNPGGPAGNKATSPTIQTVVPVVSTGMEDKRSRDNRQPGRRRSRIRQDRRPDWIQCIGGHKGADLKRSALTNKHADKQQDGRFQKAGHFASGPATQTRFRHPSPKTARNEPFNAAQTAADPRKNP